jgi:protocatechuate 3,4-dioxygenase beta subunit
VWSTQHEPISGAQVCAICASCDPTEIGAQHCVGTSDDGSFSLSGLPPMAYRVMASAPGFTAAFAEQGQSLSVDTAIARVGVDVVLDHDGVELSGHVLDATGGPVPGAKVKVVRWQRPPLVAQTETDAEGKFTAFVPAGDVTLNASAEGYASAGVFRVAPSRDIEIMLTPGASVRGVVVIGGDSTRPVVGAEVSATAVGWTTPIALTRTASDGSFVLNDLEPANYLLSATGAGFRGHAPGVLPVALAQQIQGVTISVRRAAQVSGRVVIGSSKRPCLEGSVTLGPRPPDVLLGSILKESLPPRDSERDARASFHAPIAANGSVAFDALPPARYFAAVNCRGHRQGDGPTLVEVDTKNVSGLEWRVDPGLGLVIRVVDDAKQPVPSAQVLLEWPTGAEGQSMTMPLSVDGKGETETPESLLPGVYRLQPGAGYTGDPLTVALKEGMGRVEAVLTVRGSAALAVSVKDSEGAPVDGLTVLVHAVDPEKRTVSGPSSARTRTAAAKGAGMYRAGSLSPGRYRVEVSDYVNPAIEVSTAPGRTNMLEAFAGRTTEVEVTLRRKAQISGLVSDARGAPASDIWVSVANEAALEKLDPGVRQLMPPARRVLTDTSGRFVLTGLDPSATYTVHAAEPDGSAERTLRDVLAGSETTLTLAASSAGSSKVSEAEGRSTSVEARGSPREQNAVAEGRTTTLGM